MENKQKPTNCQKGKLKIVKSKNKRNYIKISK